MSLSKFFYDFTCPDCGVFFEQRVYSFEKTTPCVNCGKEATRELASPAIAWRKMGVSKDFPTAAAKWDKMHEQQASDKGGRADGQPNLKHY